MGGEQKKEERATTPHVLIFPLPAQGHINPMLKLAELLWLAGFHVTFLNSDYNHNRFLRFSDVHTRLSSLPGFRFFEISDGLPAEHPRSVAKVPEMFDSLEVQTKPIFRELLVSWGPRSESRDPVTCVIADGIMPFTIDVAEEVGIPIIVFRTVSSASFWSYYSIPRLIQGGEIPFTTDDEDMDRVIRGVPGMESFLRCRDLPSFFRCNDLTDPDFQRVKTHTLNTTRASGLILNGIEHLEGPILSQIRNHIPTTYTIGPLHALLKSRATPNSYSSSSSGLWKEDKTCLTWLDSQPHKSVIYVSFGSLATVTRQQLLEFWYGFVSSEKPFLWVIRPDSIAGEDEGSQIPKELVEGTKERGLLVEWAPQEGILAHPSVGVFFTHSGWNSTLESIYAGVPMICWPFFADQQINSRFVSEVWKIGLDMKDTCDRETVEKMVREVMEWKREEFMASADEMAELARISVKEGGTSYNNLEKLIVDIRSISIGAITT